jgi:hypothetical protein
MAFIELTRRSDDSRFTLNTSQIQSFRETGPYDYTPVRLALRSEIVVMETYAEVQALIKHALQHGFADLNDIEGDLLPEPEASDRSTAQEIQP